MMAAPFPQAALLLVAALLVRAPAAQPVVGAYDRVCGTRDRALVHLLDLPTFWINLDTRPTQRRWMEMHLRARLATGVCATRVPAVPTSALRQVLHGHVGERLAEIVEHAIMASHLKAARVALAAEPAAPGFVILEDDVDFAPLAHFHGLLRAASAAGPLPEPRLHTRAGSSLRALLPSLRADWAIVQLEAKCTHMRWTELERTWWAQGLPPALDKEHLMLRAPSGAPCAMSAMPWSTTAYVLSPRAARELVERRWPVTLDSSAPGGVRIHVERSCYHPRFKWKKECSERRFRAAQEQLGGANRTIWHADWCLVNSVLFGPPLTAAALHRTQVQARLLAREERLAQARANAPGGGGPHGAQPQARLHARANAPGGSVAPPPVSGSGWREYVAMPPWFTECSALGEPGGAHATNPTSVKHHCWAKIGAFAFYRRLCVLMHGMTAATNKSDVNAIIQHSCGQRSPLQMLNSFLGAYMHDGLVITRTLRPPAPRLGLVVLPAHVKEKLYRDSKQRGCVRPTTLYDAVGKYLNGSSSMSVHSACRLPPYDIPKRAVKARAPLKTTDPTVGVINVRVTQPEPQPLAGERAASAVVGLGARRPESGRGASGGGGERGGTGEHKGAGDARAAG